MGNAYTYYSYEEYGRGYIGARSKSPLDDDDYFGTFSETNFHPTHKIILSEFETMEEALAAEVELHKFFEVDINPHFANKAKQTSSGFYFDPTGREVRDEERRKNRAAWTPERRKAQAERMAKQNKSDRHRQSMVERNKSNKMREATAERNTRHCKGKPLSQEHRNKISESGKGVKRTPEQIENYRRAAQKREDDKKKQRG